MTVGPGQHVTRNAEHYTLGHAGRFVKPRAERIATASFGRTTGGNGQLMDVAFRNPDEAERDATRSRCLSSAQGEPRPHGNARAETSRFISRT